MTVSNTTIRHCGHLSALGRLIPLFLLLLGLPPLSAQEADRIQLSNQKDLDDFAALQVDRQRELEEAKPADAFAWREVAFAWEQKHSAELKRVADRFRLQANAAAKAAALLPAAVLPVPEDAVGDERAFLTLRNSLDLQIADLRRALWNFDSLDTRDAMMRWEQEHADEIEARFELSKALKRKADAAAGDIEIGFDIPADATTAERTFLREEQALLESRLEIMNRDDLTPFERRDALFAWELENAPRFEAQQARADELNNHDQKNPTQLTP